MGSSLILTAFEAEPRADSYKGQAQRPIPSLPGKTPTLTRTNKPSQLALDAYTPCLVLKTDAISFRADSASARHLARPWPGPLHPTTFAQLGTRSGRGRSLPEPRRAGEGYKHMPTTLCLEARPAQSSFAIISCSVKGVKWSISRPCDASTGRMCAGTSFWFKLGAIESSVKLLADFQLLPTVEFLIP